MKGKKINFRLLVITDRKLAKGNFSELLKKCCKSGIKAIQIREKNLPSSEITKLSKKIKSFASKSKTKVLINDRLDIALLSGADGVHSPEKGVQARYIKKYNLISGKSVHSVRQAIKAEKEGYDYLLFGPVYRTPAKVKYGSPHGLNKLKQVCGSVKVPVFAVGGITPRRVKKCLKAGAYGVAVIRAVMKSKNVRKSISEFKSELGEL